MFTVHIGKVEKEKRSDLSFKATGNKSLSWLDDHITVVITENATTTTNQIFMNLTKEKITDLISELQKGLVMVDKDALNFDGPTNM